MSKNHSSKCMTRYLEVMMRCLIVSVFTISLMIQGGCASMNSRQKTLGNIYQQDFRFFTETMKNAHPNIRENLPDYDQKADQVYHELAQEKDLVHFEVTLRQFTHLLGDGHTGLSYKQERTPVHYPLQVEWIEKQWYISVIDTTWSTCLGASIRSINGVEAGQVMEQLMNLISGENIYWFRARASGMLMNPDNLRLLGLSSADDQLHLRIEKGGQVSDLSLPAQQTKAWSWIGFHGLTRQGGDNYWGEAVPGHNAYYLQFNAFEDGHEEGRTPKFTGWRNYLDQVFTEIDSLKLQNLVVDLRNNGGGNSLMGDILLSYCALEDSLYSYSGEMVVSDAMLRDWGMTLEQFNQTELGGYGLTKPVETLPYHIKSYGEKPVKQPTKSYFAMIAEGRKQLPLFKGRLILLVGSNSFSSASGFATYCQDNGIAVIYGSPTGGKPSCFGDILSYTLPNTGLHCRVSYKYFRRPDFRRDPADSLYPDVLVNEDAEAFFAGRDIVWERVLKDIDQNTIPTPMCQ